MRAVRLRERRTMEANVCSRCRRAIERDIPFCTCGAPTPHASFKERVEYELAQWRTHRDDEEAATA